MYIDWSNRRFKPQKSGMKNTTKKYLVIATRQEHAQAQKYTLEEDTI